MMTQISPPYDSVDNVSKDILTVMMLKTEYSDFGGQYHAC